MGGGSGGVVIGFGGGATFVCRLVFGGEGLMVSGKMAWVVVRTDSDEQWSIAYD